MTDDDRGNLRRRRQEIVHEAGVDDLTLFVVDQSLVECASNTLRDAAMHLPLNHHRIDNAPTVMYRRVLEERDHAGLRVNLDNGPMHAAGEAGMWRAVKLGGLKSWPTSFLGQSRARTRTSQLHRHQFAGIFAIGVAQRVGGDRHLTERE